MKKIKTIQVLPPTTTPASIFDEDGKNNELYYMKFNLCLLCNSLMNQVAFILAETMYFVSITNKPIKNCQTPSKPLPYPKKG